MADLTPDNYWPLGSTVQKTDFASPQDRYRHFGILSANPVDGHMVMIYRNGGIHVGDKGTICIRHSSDGGTNWDSEVDVYSDADYDVRPAGGGYTSNERLFVFFSRCTPDANPTWIDMKYIYSDNNGASGSWSALKPLDKDVSGAGETNTRFNPYGHIVDVGNNILYQTWFGGIPYPDVSPDLHYPSLYRIYLYKSTDGGLTFPSIITVNPLPTPRQPWGEPSLVNVGGGCFLILARMNEVYPPYTECEYNHYIQFKSENNCETWINQDKTTFEGVPLDPSEALAAPPWLSFINYEGIGIVACYYTNRFDKKLKVVFGIAKDLVVNGPSGWNSNTKVEIFDYLGTTNSGYQSFFLPSNQYKGVGVCFKENGSYSAYPVVVFTKVTKTTGQPDIPGIQDVLSELGL